MSASQSVAGTTDTPRPDTRPFYPALDGLRALAFLMVLGQHYLTLPWGWTGVNVFFVLSGFLITGILFDTRDDPHRARNFYVRRSLRIFPLYYGVILLVLVSYPLMHWQWSITWLAWPLYLANYLNFIAPPSASAALLFAGKGWLYSPMLPSGPLLFGHFWSLCVEEQFYLLWPWVVFGLRSRRALLWICASAAVLGPLARIAVLHAAPPWMIGNDLLYRTTLLQLDALLLGGLVALLWRGAHRDLLLKWAGPIALTGVIVALVYIAANLHGSFLSYPYPSWILTWGLTYTNVLTAALILCCLRPMSWLTRCLSLRPLRWMGRVSYGAYIFHDIPHFLYVRLAVRLGSQSHFLDQHRNSTTMLLALAGTMVLAWLSFRFFESPFLRLKDRLSR